MPLPLWLIVILIGILVGIVLHWGLGVVLVAIGIGLLLWQEARAHRQIR